MTKAWLLRTVVLWMAMGAVCARATEIRISAQALERTLQQQLFTGADGRYYIRGDAKSGCFVYADQPRVSFADDRIVVHVHSHSRLGTSIKGVCLGVGLSPEADVSVLPEAEGETIGFRDARIEHLGESKELNFFLEPFLSHKLPQKLRIDVGAVLRATLAKAAPATGYDIKLDGLKIHSMQVQGDALVVDFDSELSVK